MPKLSIIIPAYNEEKTLRRVVEKVWSVNFPVDYEIIIVDDHSEDRSYRIARLLNKLAPDRDLKVLTNSVNRGKGYSICRGVAVASGEILIIQDADFEYDPSEIPKLIAPILAGERDVVYGSRFLEGHRPPGMAMPNLIANKTLTAITNFLFRSHLSDMETCYKAIRKDVIAKIVLNASRFDFEPEVTAKLLKLNIAIQEMPISYQGRNASQGKKIKARDFFHAILCLLKNRISG